jgi:3alpha(or 20beta)-hydroxysteroid dehydrogenase
MGAAEASLFAAEGASVVIGDVQHDLGRDVVTKIGPASRYIELDVTSEESWAQAAAFVDAEFGGLDVLINNAGVAPTPSALVRLSLAEYRRVTEVNQTGVFLGMRALAPALVRRGGGSIVNVSSISGLEGTPGALSYVASKFAVRGMTKVAALELAEFGVRVNSIHPGLINTPLSINTPVVSPFAKADVIDRVPADISACDFGVKVPLGRPGRPDEVAQLALFPRIERQLVLHRPRIRHRRGNDVWWRPGRASGNGLHGHCRGSEAHKLTGVNSRVGPAGTRWAVASPPDDFDLGQPGVDELGVMSDAVHRRTR